jgi:hypothetical protein
MAEILKIGAEFDVSNIVAGSAEASTAVQGLANAVAESSEAMAGTSARAATAMEKEAAAHIEAASAGRSHAEANIQARLTTDALTGNISRAENALIRFAAHSEALGPIMQAAFAPLAVAIFADIVIHAAEKVYQLYQNVVLLKSSIEALDKANEKEAESAARLNDSYEEQYARRLESEGKFAAARDAFRKAEEDKPLVLPKVDDKLFKQFNSEFVTFLQAVHTSADAPSVITRINAEAEATGRQLEEARRELQSLSADTGGEAAAYGGTTASLEHQQALVDDLAKKFQFLKTAIGEVQSQMGSAAISLEGSLDSVGKKEEEAAKKIIEAQYAAIIALNEQQELAAKGAEAELRQIEETERKKEETVRKAHELADQEAEYMQRMFETIDAAAKKSAETRERISREEAEVDANISRGLDEAAQRAAVKRAEIQKRQADTISRELERAIDGPLTKMIEGTERVSVAFRQMGQRIVTSVIEAFEKMLIHQIVHEAQMLILHAATNEAKVASDATAAAQTKSIETTLGIKQIVHAAAVAAAKTYASIAEIPIVGPFIAPAAAAAAFAGVIAFESIAAAEEGAYVGRTQPVLAHAGEIILNPTQTRDVGAMAKSFNEGGGGGTSINIHAFDSKSIANFLHGNRSAFMNLVRTAIRNGHRIR